MNDRLRLPSRVRFQLIAREPRARLKAFARDVRRGLTCQRKHLSCRYLYDREGSLLFEQICELPEYYLPAAERAILQAHAADVVALFPEGAVLVELGSGNAAKTRLVIEAFLHHQRTLRYVPVDISRAALEDSSRALLQEYPALEIVAVAAEYHEGLGHLEAAGPEPKLILWLGSNVGNFTRDEAARFLGEVRQTMTPEDRLLAGIDLRKGRAILERAYDDSRGVTAQFNLNLLARINRELGGHFNLDRFRHRAVYNEEAGRVEIYLDSLVEQHVRIDRLELEVRFGKGEPIHTENSYKYSRAEIETLAEASGFRLVHHWLDAGRRFSVNVLAPTPLP